MISLNEDASCSGIVNDFFNSAQAVFYTNNIASNRGIINDKSGNEV
jgi:hypothetical protein